MENQNYRKPRNPRPLQKRSSPYKKVLSIVLFAALTLVLIYILLVAIFGFTSKAVTVTQADGSEIRISFLGFMKDGVATSGSISTSEGVKGSVSSYEREDGSNVTRITYKDGSVYEGELDGFVRSGKGSLSYANGDIYVGEFKNDEIDGYGKFTYYSTGDTYEGEVHNAQKVGYGKYSYYEGTVYEGNYENDMPNGYGKLTFYDGSVYEGNFINGARQGKGKYTFSNRDVYEGDFVNGKADGTGVYAFACGDKYEGQFADGKINGEGKYTWADGRDYTGTFENGIAVYVADSNEENSQ